MNRDERRHLREIADDVGRWVRRAELLVEHRMQVKQSAEAAIEGLRGAQVDIKRDGTVAWRVIPLYSAARPLLGAIFRHTRLPSLSSEGEQVLLSLRGDAAAAVRDVQPLLRLRMFRSRPKRETAQKAAEFLPTYHSWAHGNRVPDLLASLSTPPHDRPEIDVNDALADWLGLAPRLSDFGYAPEIVTSESIAKLPEAVASLQDGANAVQRSRKSAEEAGAKIRHDETRRILLEMPVERLKEATRDRLRIRSLTDAGISTVGAVLKRGLQLQRLPGIGATSATQILGAARTLKQITFDEMPVRIDIKRRTDETTTLLRRLYIWDSMRKALNAVVESDSAESLAPLAQLIANHKDRAVQHAIVFSTNERSPADLGRVIDDVVSQARLLSGIQQDRDASSYDQSILDDPWTDFLARPADYFALLAELGFITEDDEKTHGDLPEEIVEAVRAVELDTEFLAASLRGYQSFAARFALVQRNVIVGDEMGLGKTIEALAVFTHLRAKGSHHSLVVCPAAVVTNWMREVSSKSKLRPHRLHGPHRTSAAQNWLHSGGVAVTTFETLGWIENDLATLPELGCVVVDEAHYIKNPDAKRSQRVARLLNHCDRSIFLTGTPLENRIEEFRNLVRYLRPDLIVSDDELAPRRFRRQVAPAYLRRNQEDVLTELPELVEIDEWLPLSNADHGAYRRAVAASNFMAMRKAAMSQGLHSAKLQRLAEIVEEAEDNDRKVLVFSYFLDVLDEITGVLPGKVFGPLTGSVPPTTRQAIVDEFSTAESGAVLVAQISAGGVGLNVQAASVVVIGEPQLKPTTEWQAIARAHRMGQLESVQVHRLLSEDGVDKRLLDLLGDKRRLFEDFARISEAAESAPEAYDVSEAELARQVVAAERERLYAPAQVSPAREEGAAD